MCSSDLERRTKVKNRKTGDISGNFNSVIGNENSKISICNNEGLGEQFTAVPYIVYESAMARTERHIKRLVISLIVCILTLFAANIGWLVFLSQFDFESAEISSEGGGNANYIGEDGNIYNGSYQGTENEA